MKGALLAISEGRAGFAAAGPDGTAGPDPALTITRGRELAAKVSELASALEVSDLLDALCLLTAQTEHSAHPKMANCP